MIHEHGCECDSYGCQLRRKGIAVAASATPSRGKRGKPADHTNNSWEKGIAGEDRGRGTFMPYLNDKGKPMSIKQGSEKRHEIKETRARQKSGAFFKT